jgi:hypothetical protein
MLLKVKGDNYSIFSFYELFRYYSLKGISIVNINKIGTYNNNIAQFPKTCIKNLNHPLPIIYFLIKKKSLGIPFKYCNAVFNVKV